MLNTQTCEGSVHPQQSSTGTTELTDSSLSVRYHYMDNLRALAMLVGIFFHAALAYSPLMSEIWMSADPQQSAVIDVVAFFSHLFRMPLFFVVAGFFTLMMIEKRQIKGMLQNRGKRIFLPFLIFLPLTLVGIIGGFIWATSNVENPSPMLKLIAAMSNNPDAEQPPFSTAHLWFLFNLSWFYLVAALCYKLNIHQARWLEKLMNPTFVLLVLPLLMVPALLTQTVPHPAAERIYPELWSLGFYGIFFLFGFALFKHQQLLQKLEKFTLPMLALSLAGYAVFYSLLPATITIADMMQVVANGVSITTEQVILVVLECYIAVFMTLVCLITGKKWLNSESKGFRYIADSSYWVYIVHLPVLFIVQYILLDIHWNLWVEFFISSFVTLAIGMLSYALLIRPTPLGSLLNGKRKAMFKLD